MICIETIGCIVDFLREFAPLGHSRSQLEHLECLVLHLLVDLRLDLTQYGLHAFLHGYLHLFTHLVHHNPHLLRDREGHTHESDGCGAIRKEPRRLQDRRKHTPRSHGSDPSEESDDLHEQHCRERYTDERHPATHEVQKDTHAGQDDVGELPENDNAAYQHSLLVGDSPIEHGRQRSQHVHRSQGFTCRHGHSVHLLRPDDVDDHANGWHDEDREIHNDLQQVGKKDAPVGHGVSLFQQSHPVYSLDRNLLEQDVVLVNEFRQHVRLLRGIEIILRTHLHLCVGLLTEVEVPLPEPLHDVPCWSPARFDVDPIPAQVPSDADVGS
mmetsp:Transcript_58566/g.163342  ORF Transcript_58566/g.163342 Transcript_58566/m.163342 type:complete len:326 (-) Transcript_58566:3130-4107(-)